MEPTQETLPASVELPMPVSGTSDAKGKAEDKSAAMPEVQSESTQPTSVAPQQGGTGDPQTVTTIPSVPASPPSPPGVPVDDAALMADDADLIEKEWVVRAKAVVEQTKTDPYAQNRELSKVKAEYIKKRYNKNVKVSEE